MIEEHIQDGDYVIVEERKQVFNGEVVVALIDGENVTLKKFFRRRRASEASAGQRQPGADPCKRGSTDNSGCGCRYHAEVLIVWMNQRLDRGHANSGCCGGKHALPDYSGWNHSRR